MATPNSLLPNAAPGTFAPGTFAPGGTAPVPSTGVQSPLITPLAPPPPNPVLIPGTSPAVSTSKLASSDVAKKMAIVNDTSQQIQAATTTKNQLAQQQLQLEQANASTANRTAAGATTPVGTLVSDPNLPPGYMKDSTGRIFQVPEGGQTGATGPSQGPTEAQAGGQGATGATGPQTQADANETARQAQLQQTMDALTKAESDHQAAMAQFANGTFPLTPDQQSLLDNISQQFQGLINDQKLANQNYVGAITQAGIASGRNRYAPEISLGEVNAAIATGANEIAKLNGEMSKAVLTAKIAFSEQNYKRLDDAYESLTKSIESRQAVLDKMYSATQDVLDEAHKKHQDYMEELKYDFEVTKELNKPLLESDAKIQDTLMNLIEKFPDANVLPSDTIQQATQKITQSPTYQAELAKTIADASRTASGGVTDTTKREFATQLWNSGGYGSYGEAYQAATAMLENPEGTVASGTPAQSFMDPAAQLVAGNITNEAQRGTFLRNFKNLSSVDPVSARDLIISSAIETLPAAQQGSIYDNYAAVKEMRDISGLISQYVKDGGKLDLLNGTKEQIENKLGKTTDPKLAKLGARIANALFDFRHAKTGAAASASEMAQYNQVFPTIKKSEQLNVAQLEGLTESLESNLGAKLELRLGRDNWNAIKDVGKTSSRTLKDGTKAVVRYIGNGQYEVVDGTSPKVEGGSKKTGAADARTIAAAIKQVESGGRYDAKGASGEYGAYQFMPSTWKGWAKTYLGSSDAPMTQANQDKVAEARISDLLKQGRTPREIALIWNGGQPIAKKGVNSKGVKYDSGSYADKVLKQLS